MEALSAHDRRLKVVMLGHEGDAAGAEEFLADSDASVRVAALGALARCGTLCASHVEGAMGDEAPQVRARAAELAPVEVDILELLSDPDATVVESAAAALGERDSDPSSISELSRVALGHDELLCRESAIASVGSVAAGLDAVLHFGIDERAARSAGHVPRLLTCESRALPPAEQAELHTAMAVALETLLAAMNDRPPVRRRALLGLYVYEDVIAQQAVRAALDDTDGQVRALAGDLLNAVVA